MKSNKVIIRLFLLLGVFHLLFISCGVNKNRVQSQNNTLFAELKENRLEFKIDTLKFKNNISKSIFSVDSNIAYDKLEIVKQFTIGDKKHIFYYLMLTDFDKKVKTTRWLVVKDNYLYLNENVQKNNDNFELIYLTCAGNQNCNPNIFALEGKKVWLCGDNPKCLIDGETRKGCDSYTTFIEP